MGKYFMHDYPFVQARHVGGKQRPTAITIRLSSTTSDRGAALGVAMYHHRASSPLEAHHYILDEKETYRCIPVDVAAYNNPHRAISVLICAQPHEYVPLCTQGELSPVMKRAAKLVAELSLAYKIKLRYLDSEAKKTWERRRWRHNGGLIINAIGTWPYGEFLSEAQAQKLVKTN